MDDLPELSNTNTQREYLPSEDVSTSPNNEVKNENSFQLIGRIFTNLNRQQKITLAGILGLVFGLPLIVTGLYGTKLINQKAYEPVTPPITDITLETPQPTSIALTPTPGPCVTNKPTVEVIPHTQSGEPGEGLIYSINVTNNDTGSCSDSKFKIATLLPNGNWSANLPENLVQLYPGQQRSVNLLVISPSDIANGRYQIYVKISDMSLKAHSDSNVAYYSIGNGPIESPLPTPKPTPTPTPQPITMQIIKNGSFDENSNKDKIQIPNSWKLDTGSLSKQEGFTCGTSSDGKCSLLLGTIFTTKIYAAKAISQTATFSIPGVGKESTLTYTARSQNAWGLTPAMVRVEYFDKNGKLVGTMDTAIRQGTHDFEVYTNKSTNPDFTSVKVSLISSNIFGKVWFDTVKLNVNVYPTATPSTPTPTPMKKVVSPVPVRTSFPTSQPIF